MCRSDALIGLISTRTSASPEAKDGIGTSSNFNTLVGSPVSRKINAFITIPRVFSRRLIQAGCSTSVRGFFCTGESPVKVGKNRDSYYSESLDRLVYSTELRGKKPHGFSGGIQHVGLRIQRHCSYHWRFH